MRLKPGKPLFFGRRGETLVFGLPGNPLSSRRLLPRLRRAAAAPPARRARAAPGLRARPPRGAREAEDGRTTFLTARLRARRGRRAARRRRPSARART